MSTDQDTPPSPPTDDIVQEPKKTKGVVGERLWGPYRTHSGTSMSEKYSGGPWGLGNLVKIIIFSKVCFRVSNRLVCHLTASLICHGV